MTRWVRGDADIEVTGTATQLRQQQPADEPFFVRDVC